MLLLSAWKHLPLAILFPGVCPRRANGTRKRGRETETRVVVFPPLLATIVFLFTTGAVKTDTTRGQNVRFFCKTLGKLSN